jgi:glycosyltransferase involved in cell wall biosynthesis
MGSRLAPGANPVIPSRVIVDVVIPALNEEDALPRVIAALPRPPVRRIVVGDNGSTDRTAEVARASGADVVLEPARGYGAACLAALAALRADPPDVVVFIDGDYSDDPAELPLLLAPILAGEAALVVGSRTRGRRERFALTPQQEVGNRIACAALRLGYGAHYSDLGPFRAIRWDALERIGMTDRAFGFTVEMQIKAAQLGIPHAEVPVSYRRRIGESKISGTLRGTLLAGGTILFLLAKYRWASPRWF